MAYYLGKDVGVELKTENSTYGITVGSDNILTGSGSPSTIGELANPDFDAGVGVISNLTGVDLGLGTTDEDVSFMGANTPLKAEVKKETTVTLTKKKNSPAFDVIFSGDTSGNCARWGVTGSAIRDGLSEPDVTFGYRIFVQLKSTAEIIAIRNAQMTSHTVSLNADGTQEETIEFASQTQPMIYTGTGSGGLDRATDATEL